MYLYILIEVTTVCNARCPWCFATRITDAEEVDRQTGFMTLDQFTAIIDRLQWLGLIGEATVIHLYGIGEPFLNKDLLKMIELLTERGLHYAISTNASVVPRLPEGNDALRYLSSLIVSISGFSQGSYDRAHGFRFEKIKHNILAIKENFARAGFSGDFRISYHVYQYNLDDIPSAKWFADQHGINFYPYYAIFHDYRSVMAYVNNSMPYETLKKASQELFLCNIDRSVASRSDDFVCEFHRQLIVDASYQLKTCCLIQEGDKSYSFGSLFELNREEILARRINQPVCKGCQTNKLDNYCSAMIPFQMQSVLGGEESEQRDHQELWNLLKHNRHCEVVLFGAGQVGRLALQVLRDRNIPVSCFADNSPQKSGRDLDGIPVVSPARIRELCRDPLVIITNVNHRQVRKQLAGLGVERIACFLNEDYGSIPGSMPS